MIFHPGRNEFKELGKQYQADFQIIHQDDDLIYIKDLNLGSMSVTNDVENVLKRICAGIHEGIGKRRVFYKDSMGRIDEIQHDRGHFKGFKNIPYGDPLLKRCYT